MAITTVQLTPQQTETVAVTDDEDYKWLTDLLDAIRAEMAQMRETFRQSLEAQSEANRNTSAEAQTMIRALTELSQSMSQNLTALAASVTLKLTRPDSPNTSTPELVPVTEPEPVPVTEPASVNPEATPDNRVVEDSPARRRKRL